MNKVDFNKVGNFILILRNNIGLTQQELADILGKSKPAICQWEAGMGIKTETLYELSKLFNVTIEELLEGKKNDESNESLWTRMYDLSLFDFDEEITDKNINLLKKYYDCCKNIKERFYLLIIKWANGSILNNELDEFYYIKQYFEVDRDYCSHIKFGPGVIGFINENDEKEFIKKNYDEYYQSDIIEYNWQVSKIYNFVPNLKEKEVYASNSTKTLELLLSIFNQPQKDALLRENLKKPIKEKTSDIYVRLNQIYEGYSIEEIENIWFFKVMLNAGCNIIFEKTNVSTIDEEIMEKMIGNIKEISYKKFDVNVAGNSFDPIVYWKLLSYKEYISFVDIDKTNWYNDIVNLKDSNPNEYYKRYVNRNKI